MKKIILLLSVVLFSCEDGYEEQMRPKLSKVKRPAIVVAVKKREPDAGFHGGFGSIILQDKTGKLFVFDGNSFDGEALVASLNKGDTLK